MIDIFINNQKADFFGSLTIKKDNPLFSNFDAEPTEHTYTLTLPTTATNAKIFSLVQHTLATPQKLPARIEIDGVQVLEGSCNVQSWSDSGYSVYFSGIAPYEDVNISPIKKMLGDTRMISDILSFGSIRVDSGDTAGSIDNGLILGLVYAYTEGENVELITSNVAFSIPLLIQRIANYYGINIQQLDSLADYYIVCAGKPSVRIENFQGIPLYYIDIDKSVPKIKAKELIESVVSAFGYKIKIDYINKYISFYSLDDFKTSSVAISHSKCSINFNDDIPIVGKFNFAQYNDFEISTDDGKKKYPYTTLNNIEISNGTAKYDNRLSVMQMRNNVIIMPRDKEGEEDKELIALCRIASSDIYTLTMNSYAIPEFKLYKNIASRKMKLKLTSQLNPIQFTTLNMWRPIYLDNIGSVFINSINFKSDGESEIEAYLY